MAYEKGEGMGLAKAAELNDYPGPRHVLDMDTELRLTDRQEEKTRQTFDQMHTKAVQIGRELVEAD
jgi:hypothetical protein